MLEVLGRFATEGFGPARLRVEGLQGSGFRVYVGFRTGAICSGGLVNVDLGGWALANIFAGHLPPPPPPVGAS